MSSKFLIFSAFLACTAVCGLRNLRRLPRAFQSAGVSFPAKAEAFQMRVNPLYVSQHQNTFQFDPPATSDEVNASDAVEVTEIKKVVTSSLISLPSKSIPTLRLTLR